MPGHWAHKGLQPPSNPKERKGLKEAQHAAHPHPPWTREVISVSLEGSHRDPRLRPASPPRSRVANLPSSGQNISASLEGSEPTLEQGESSSPRSRPPLDEEGQTALPLTRPSYGLIKCQPLHHSAQDRRRQAAIPHSGCDRSPVRQLRSLLHHPRRCGSTVEPATRDETCSALLELLCSQLSMPPSYFPFRGAPERHGHDPWKQLRP